MRIIHRLISWVCLSGICFIFICCTENSKLSKLEIAMELAAGNAEELKKVLEFYSRNPQDSLKLKAACFLIENMPYHSTLVFPGSKDYYHKVDSILRIDNMTPGYSNIIKMEMRKTENKVNWQAEEQVPDITQINSSFLIEHIENAFHVKEYPWYRELSFEDFCEFILPYRIMDEPLENWISVYRNSLMEEQDTLRIRNATDSMVCNYFINYFFQPYEYKSYTYQTDFLPSTYLHMKIGSCRDLTAFGIYTLRSLGVAVTWDYTPQWGNRSRGHDWISLLRTGKAVPFAFGDRVAMGKHKEDEFKEGLVKAYRRTFSAQQESLPLRYPEEKIPYSLTDPCIKDVSCLYFDPVDLHIDLTDSSLIPPQKISYICVFNNQEWVPVHWSEIIKKKACFSAMAKNKVYCAMYFHNNRLFPATRPFLVDSLGNIDYLVPDINNVETVTLKRKYKTYPFPPTRMVGGKFQGANKADFSDAVDLHVIEEYRNDIIPKYVSIESPGTYRYFRYLSAPGAHVYMAEIELYDENDKLVSGTIIGTEGSYMNDGNMKDHVFDKNPLTYFNAPNRSDCWAGLKFNKKERITRLVYMPKNDDNFICTDQHYELFYFDNEWVSLGNRVGDQTHILTYDNVPKGALLLLKNHSKGIEERIFTYKNEEQVWW